jgi:antitoxin component of RelBE/YafQ-DinJ toxin-antitoxin module
MTFNPKHKFRRVSISLDDISKNRAATLADEMSCTISGVVRLLLKKEYEKVVRSAEKERVTA